MFHLLDRVEVVRDVEVPLYPEPTGERPWDPEPLETLRISAGWTGDVVAVVRRGGRKQTVIATGSAQAGYALVDDADLRAVPAGR